VLILGAGPVGLLLALCLTELGVRVSVVERGPSTKRDPRAAIVWPRVAEVLRSVGVIDRFEAAACRLQRAEFRVDGRYAGAMALGRLACANPYPLMIEQHVTERLLAERLAERGVTVRWDTEATDVRTRADGADVDLRGPDGAAETVSCAWVVGCDGARSLVRKRLGIAFEGAARVGVECVQVNARPTWSLPDDRATGYFFVVPGRTLLACPLPDGGYRFVCFSAVRGAAPEGEPDLAELRALVADATREPVVDLAPTEPRWVNRARFQDRVAARLVDGRALLAGDAAHVWTPVGGHGMNAGMRGAQNLAWKLAAVLRGEAPTALLDTYSDEQRAAARAVIDGLTRWKTEEPSPAWVVRLIGLALPLALRGVDRFPPVEARLSELDAAHHGSALSCALTPFGALRPGDRLPDVTVRHEGLELRCHDLLALSRWTLLATVDGARDDAHVARLRRLADRYRAQIRVTPVRAEGASRRALDGDSRAVLVRPDAHVAAVARVNDDAALGQYLDAHLTRA
jgi:2-polyprenyl-6-methoxyphenol hydroxylase-like FAD-dependent oxidoreductase